MHPETGAVRSYGRTSYRAGADLSGYLRTRDGRCRFPGCARRAHRTDLDHTVAWAHGGATSHDNLASLCRAHHRLKHESGWRVVQEAGGVMRWTSPAGHVLRTMPERPFMPVAHGAVPGLDPGRQPLATRVRRAPSRHPNQRRRTGSTSPILRGSMRRRLGNAITSVRRQPRQWHPSLRTADYAYCGRPPGRYV